ncbi:hypothetical protein BDZ97DRAFT_1590776, partial [Flammula alnicola]
LKEKGIIKDSCRTMVRELGAMKIPEEKQDRVIKAVAQGLGIHVVDSISSRSTGRIMLEGGIGSQVQLVSEIEGAKAMMLSGDGTTIRHRNYESRHINLQVPSYEQGRMEKTMTTRSMGIGSAPNHTSDMQLHGLQEQSQRIYGTYNRSRLGKVSPADVIAFATYLLGLGSDHAEDQKRLARLLLLWKIISEKEIRGRRYMEATAISDLLPIILEANNQKIQDAGGVEAWDALSEAEKDRRDAEVYKKLCLRFGEEAWSKLSAEELREAQLFVWAGCCMHKEMNSVKGGAKALASFWKEAGLIGPIKLMNRDNAAAASLGPSSANDRAVEVSEGGAVKLTSLAGAIFNHKDQKKGQQDTCRIFFEDRLGYAIHFPDTSNTRFQSHCEAASELIVHLPLYLEFLLLVRDKKDNRNFNHMENNVFNALKDIPTITELCVLSLYSQAISNPYMRKVRGSGERRMNTLDAGPLHQEVKDHINRIIQEPELLLRDDASYTTGALDGQIWERPEAVYAVHCLKNSLPHLRECLIAFFKGALETWYRFTSEFAEDSIIAGLSQAEKDRIHIDTTNDPNEGNLGVLRQDIRHAPNISLSKANARSMYKKNRTADFIQHSFNTAEDQAFLRAEARKQDAAGIPRESRRVEAAYDRADVEKKRGKDAQRKTKADARTAVLDALKVELDVDTLKKGQTSTKARMNKDDIRLQINWHR